MKLTEPKFEILDQGEGLEGVYRQIEISGRTCYKSEKKMTETSAKEFVERMIKLGHGAMLEHGTVYLTLPDRHSADKYRHNKYSCAVGSYVTTNLRVLVERRWMDDLRYLCEPTEYHMKRVTVRFTCGIDISREFNRHRVNSMAEQSTRYCNYSRDRFGNELSIIKPIEFAEEEINYRLSAGFPIDNAQEEWFRLACRDIADDDDYTFGIIDTWLFAHLAVEWSYMRLIELGWKPQQARRVLNLDTATELVHTAFVHDWQHFFKLRCDSAAHPQARELAIPLEAEFKNRGLIK